MSQEQRRGYLAALTKEINRALTDAGKFLFGENHDWDNHALWKCVQQQNMPEVPLFHDDDNDFCAEDWRKAKQLIAQGERWGMGVPYFSLVKEDPTFRPAALRPFYLFEKSTEQLSSTT